MGDRTAIEWTDASWNPIRAADLATGGLGHYCAHVSEGCRNCYAERLQKRFGQTVPFMAQLRDRVEIRLDERALLQPLRWRRPRRIFVCSMTDLFGDWVDDAMLDRVFAVMALCPQHTFQVLTKRPERMRGYLTGEHPLHRLHHTLAGEIGSPFVAATRKHGNVYSLYLSAPWPLPNVWLGVSVEDQAAADARVPVLLDTPAAVRFVSAEPLLGAVRLDRVEMQYGKVMNALVGTIWHPGHCGENSCTTRGARIDWVIAGGESGPGARPMHPDWARGLRDQCAAAGVPFFFKQWGEWAPLADDLPSEIQESEELAGRMTVVSQRVGKARAGRVLDGVTHDGFPAGAPA